VPGRRALEDEPSPPRRSDPVDDDDDEPTKKPLHLLQLQTSAMQQRFSPVHHAAGAQLKPPPPPASSYRGGACSPPPPLQPVRYHHAHQPMASPPMHAWPDSVEMLPAPGLQQQQQRLQGAGANHQLSPYHTGSYMMTGDSYQSWYVVPGSAQQLHQPPQPAPHHLSTLLS